MAGLLKRLSLLVFFALAGASAAQADDLRSLSFPEESFSTWLGGFRAEALSQGISATTLERAFRGITPNPRVVALDRQQPDSTRTVKPDFVAYLNRRLTSGKVRTGRARANAHAALLNEIEAAYGVPKEIIVGIWGMETSYGSYMGDFDVIRALATLAYDGRRRELFTRELHAVLKILDRGYADQGQLKGSWAGAMGQSQFLPTSYLEYAVDHDGDGHRDLWSSQGDVFASIANYLVGYGWEPGEGWGYPVLVPEGFDRSAVATDQDFTECVEVLKRHSRWLSLDEWKALGIRPSGGELFKEDGATLATLVEPNGPGGPAYLTLKNYRVILKYNCSNFYALSVALLGDAVE